MANNDNPLDRLIAENTLNNRMINEAKIELSQFGDISGMSFIASIKTIVKKYNDLVTENSKLKEELKIAKKKR